MLIGARTAMWSGGSKLTIKDYPFYKNGQMPDWWIDCEHNDGIDNPFNPSTSQFVNLGDSKVGSKAPFVVKDGVLNADGLTGSAGSASVPYRWVTWTNYGISKCTIECVVKGISSFEGWNYNINNEVCAFSASGFFAYNIKTQNSITSTWTKKSGGKMIAYDEGLLHLASICDCVREGDMFFLPNRMLINCIEREMLDAPSQQGGADVNARYSVNSRGGVFYAFRVHFRELSDAELAANYAIDKARFGLP